MLINSVCDMLVAGIAKSRAVIMEPEQNRDTSREIAISRLRLMIAARRDVVLIQA